MACVRAGLCVCVLAFLTRAPVRAESPQGTSDIIPAGAKLELLWDEGEFTEGVAVAPDGRIYFSDIPKTPGVRGRVLRFDPRTGRTVVHAANSGKSNGLMFDRGGRLIACCGAHEGRRALCEVKPDGSMHPLVERFEGKPFNSPNDLVILPNGRIYFSDPRYIGAEPVDLDHQSVYRRDPDGRLVRLTTGVSKPNGVHVSPGGDVLYVAETDNGSLGEGHPQTPVRMTLNAFPIRADGSLGPRKVLVNFGSKLGVDGMAIDVRGNIYAAVRSDDRHGIVIYDPTGKERAIIPTDELPTNCCFGRGGESKTLYVTSGGSLFRIRLLIDGFHPATS